MAHSVQQLAKGWTTEKSELESRYGQEFSILHVVQTDSGGHPTSYPLGTGALSPGVKRLGREADHSAPTSAKVEKNVALYIHSSIRFHGGVLNQLRTRTLYIYLLLYPRRENSSNKVISLLSCNFISRLFLS
jgi:hypothetical protein